MKKLISKIEILQKMDIGVLINRRIREFKKLGKQPSQEIFKELCFCLLTANFNAERAIEIQKKIGEGFLSLPEKRLAATLRALGYRYPNARAKYIAEARRYKDSIRDYVGRKEEQSRRDWLVKNIKGLGYKEGSHFLRNIGHQNLAIIDFHIIDLLERHGLIARPKTLTKAKYLKIEEVLREISRKSNLTLAELDLYLWYIETGKVLK
ncbi:MAG: N-glycosylase/DNA lyase [Candidatus Spechtbacterales bacterium]